MKNSANHTSGATSNQDWWPNQLKLDILHQHSSLSNPLGEDFNYAKEFQTLNLKTVWISFWGIYIRKNRRNAPRRVLVNNK